MDSEEVLILGVEQSIDCVCLSKRERAWQPSDCMEITPDPAGGKGKEPDNPLKIVRRKRRRDLTFNQDQGEVIVICDNEQEMLPDSLRFDTPVPQAQGLNNPTLALSYQYERCQPPLPNVSVQSDSLSAPQCKFPSLDSLGEDLERDSPVKQSMEAFNQTHPANETTVVQSPLFCHTNSEIPMPPVTCPWLGVPPFQFESNSSISSSNLFVSTRSSYMQTPSVSTSISSFTDTSYTSSSLDIETPVTDNKQLEMFKTHTDASLFSDERFARKLQAEEYATANNKAFQQISCDEKLARELMINELQSCAEQGTMPASTGADYASGALPPACSLAGDSVKPENPMIVDKNCSKVEEDTDETSGVKAVPSTPSCVSGLERMPTCWTGCPKCLPTDQRRYHVIDVSQGSSEWDVVSKPLTQANFVVVNVKRIQNESLWQRLCYEKQLMLRERIDVNMQLLYHTSRAKTSVICEEGLDVRLSRNGLFGNGIYFSDNPIKCNRYWAPVGSASSREMFVCRVLLGHIKQYPEGHCDRNLKREPPKEAPKYGEPKTYDSVKGTLHGFNEYVVYNAYRVMPEYIIEYLNPSLPPVGLTPPLPMTNYTVSPNLASGTVPTTTKRRGGKKTRSRRKA